jgi:ubiquinone/menaquinone biosynthesis C-methylase UbiE
MSVPAQHAVDARNAAFWDELCGTSLAKSIGVTDRTPESLRSFDDAYIDVYPYLPAQLRAPHESGEPLLEIGLGYGTVSQHLAEAGFGYHGLDIAAGPVEMVRHRLRMLDVADAERRVVQGSALDIPHPDGTFGHLVSIGCLHHTGDVPKAVSEVRRVLAPGGTAMVMLYNRHSLRQLVLRWRQLAEDRMRATYDANSSGEAAPATVFVTARQVREELFAPFAEVRIERHNFDAMPLLSRKLTLPTVARVLGLDLYIHARK